jgi:RHS repeat-associated protein
VIAETDLNGNTTNEYVFFAGRRISRIDASGNVFFYYADHLGTTRTITNGTGTTCYDADFTPYGQEMVHTNNCPQIYKFTGYERDPETGLDYAMFRYYNPRLGRFMSSDPLGGDLADPQSQDGYSYVRNSTTAFVDPLGLSRNPAYFADTNPGANINSFTYWGIPVFDMTGFGFTDAFHGSVWGEDFGGVYAGRALPGIVTPPDIRKPLPADWQTGPITAKPQKLPLSPQLQQCMASANAAVQSQLQTFAGYAGVKLFGRVVIGAGFGAISLARWTKYGGLWGMAAGAAIGGTIGAVSVAWQDHNTIQNIQNTYMDKVRACEQQHLMPKAPQ